jgi:hypothetical protein
MSYKYSYRTRDIKFCLKEWLPTAEVLAYDRYKDYYSIEDLDMIIDQVRKIAAEVLAPIADDGETIGASWKQNRKPVRFGHHRQQWRKH